MQTSGAIVYIPLPDLTKQDNKLLEIKADNQLSITSEKTEGVNPVAEMLLSSSVYLYKEGDRAVNAVRKLNLINRRFSIHKHISPYNWLESQRLYTTNSHFENCEGNSARLGLAIALLLNASTSPTKHAIATGSLNEDIHKSSDVAIGVVGSIPEKLSLLLEKRKNNALTDKHLYFFTPKFYAKEGQSYPVADLPQVKELAALNIEVKPIEWLSEAAKILKADKARYSKEDKLIGFVAGIFASLILGFVLYQSWWHNPIPFKMLPGDALAEPFLVCTNRDNSAVKYHDLERDGSVPIFPMFAQENKDHNVSIGWKLQPEKTLLSNRYYVGFINLGNQSGFKAEFSANQSNKESTPMTVDVNAVFKEQWQMEEDSVAEDNFLLLVLQRTPIDANHLNEAFYAKFPEWRTPPSKELDTKKPPLDIAKARDFLLDEFPNNYVFPYKSIISNPPCIKSSF